ncbi:MAG TPA: hypothetical protein VG273_28460 [Bryobacteraceae bacterium]|nr:hypothetical protein [Bryobacteraceae bacterium]
MAGSFFSALSSLAPILAGFLCCALTSLAFGLAALKVLQLDFSKGETIAIGYLIGSAINSAVTLGLGLAGAIGKPVFISITLASLSIFWLQRKWFASRPGASGGPAPLAIRLLLLLALVCYGTMYFRQALSPETSPDGTEYHLGLVNLWTHAGRIYRIADIYAAFPHAMEMLYLFAFAIGRHSAAALVHLTFLFDLPVLILLYGRRFGWNYFATGFAAILLFASPTLGIDGTSAYNDLALASACFASIYLLQIWRQNRSRNALIACGLLAGLASAIKYSAFPLPIVIMAVVAWDLRLAGSRKVLRGVVAAIIPVALVCGPYLLRNWIWFDNPVAAFGNAIFHNAWFHLSEERAYQHQMSFYGGVSWREIAMGLTIGNSKLPDSYGPVFLLMPLGAAGLIWRESRLLVMTGLALAVVYFSNKDPRFLLPATVFMTMGLAFTLSRIPRVSAALCAIAAIHLVISWPAFIDSAHFPPVWQWRLHPVSWKDAARVTPESEYLSRQPGYVLARQVDALVPEGEPVLTFTGGAWQSYTNHQMIVCWRSAYGERMADLLFSKWHSPQDSRKKFSFTLPRTGIKGVRLIQNGSDDIVMWNVDEVQFRSGGKPVPVQAAWKISASPNPWDLRDAFDGKLATRWRSWANLRPGMFIAVDFGSNASAPDTPDAVDVILDNREWITTGPGVWAALVSLEATTMDGKTLRISPEVTMQPPTDLRKESEEALEAGGIHYLVINDGDYQQSEFRQKPEAWNMHAIAKSSTATLFHLD